MAEGPSLVVQSVLYGNPVADVARAVEATANSARLAVLDGVIGSWSVVLGDCSPEPVLDAAATSSIRDVISAAGGALDVEVFGKNLGSAAGHNALATRTDADLIVILNPDAQMGADAIEALVAALRSGVGVAEARQIPFEHPKDWSIHTGDTSWASTACAITPRSVFDAMGGFDSDTFFLYCDDVDYSWRVRLAGHRVVFQPAARIFHDKRLTVTGDWPSSAAERYYSAEAAILLAYKWSRPDILRSVIAGFRRSGDPDGAKAIAEFERRRSVGELPLPLDADHRIGSFVKGNYAVHRF